MFDFAWAYAKRVSALRLSDLHLRVLFNVDTHAHTVCLPTQSEQPYLRLSVKIIMLRQDKKLIFKT